MIAKKHYVFADGERASFLLDDIGIPLFYPTLFTTAVLRGNGDAANTIRNKQQDLKLLLEWEQSRKLDLFAEMRNGTFLSVSEICALRDIARRSIRREKQSGYRKRRRAPQIEFIGAHLDDSLPSPSASKSIIYGRLTVFAAYIKFVGDIAVQGSTDSGRAKLLDRTVERILDHRPKGVKRFVVRQDELDIAPEVFARFMVLIDPSNPENPFKGEATRLRNAIMFGLLFYTGMRRGELLSLKIDQFDLREDPKVSIRRNQDDVADTRRHQPASKTAERLLAFESYLADLIIKYLKFRRQFQKSKRHPYLFVSHDKGIFSGAPISISGFQKIISTARSVNKDFRTIRSHQFRHNYNDWLSRGFDAHNQEKPGVQGATHEHVTESQQLDIRAYLNGHRDRTSGAHYNRRYLVASEEFVFRRTAASAKRLNGVRYVPEA